MQVNPSTPICGPPRNARVHVRVLAVVVAVLFASAAGAAWVNFVDQTNSRLIAATERGADDPREKDYAWGDVDHDGDIDLVVARKEPFTSPGKDPNVLFINENGVLTDRTADFATDSDVPGDQGFLTPTNDRDVTLTDVDNDGWLDIVTAPTYMDSDPKHIGHPRVYINKGCSGSCSGTADWLGFRYEEARIPELLSDSLQAGFQPRFCSVHADDYNGDGYVDLWFADYDNGQPAGADFNMKLLANEGASNPGHFIDVTEDVFVGGASNYNDIGFGASSAIVDFNGDTFPDLIKQSPGSIVIAYQDASTPGFFDQQETVYTNSGYFMNYGDLNNDLEADLIISDDGADRFLLNQGPGAGGAADFISFVFSFQHQGVGGPSGDDGFAGNSIAADLNNDGWDDVLITDADVDIGGCTRRTHIYRNSGGVPGGNVTLTEVTEGFNCATFQGNPSTCTVTGIPSDKLEGTHDIAVFDINGDGWKDLVVGRCSGTEVYLNNPPILPAGRHPGRRRRTAADDVDRGRRHDPDGLGRVVLAQRPRLRDLRGRARRLHQSHGAVLQHRRRDDAYLLPVDREQVLPHRADQLRLRGILRLRQRRR